MSIFHYECPRTGMNIQDHYADMNGGFQVTTFVNPASMQVYTLIADATGDERLIDPFGNIREFSAPTERDVPYADTMNLMFQTLQYALEDGRL